MRKQVWEVSIRDDATGVTWWCEQVVEGPLAQASAEVKAIREGQRLRPNGDIRCTFSRFLREEV